MKNFLSILTLSLPLLFVGCGSDVRRIDLQPSLAVAGEIKGDATRIKTLAREVKKTGAAPDDVRVAEIEERAVAAETRATTLETQLGTAQKKADAQSGELTTALQKLAEADGAIWQRNFAILVLLIGIGGYAVAKFYFHLPI